MRCNGLSDQRLKGSKDNLMGFMRVHLLLSELTASFPGSQLGSGVLYFIWESGKTLWICRPSICSISGRRQASMCMGGRGMNMGGAN